ncbi:MAG TPA: substrate-binding domain-containing protein [Ignavibacteria bacterium]|nr:substrate-binding domain-containing protein [Ignavibacteria bacterium]HRF66077.1 substrate-binding domain-containing protein [Ignavibacteria bacterium]HRJ04836.1 substrate-binding domain-containing protein [Ignavibacteria bacterium]HRJ86048.1 substrate-binding domain-containing protein [Ignavibacteria bacterium]
MKKIMLFAAVLSLITFSACDYTVKKSASTTGELTVGVDEGISPVVQEEASEFMRLNNEAKVTLNIKTTKEVIADLNNGTYKSVVVGRDLTKEEADIFAANKIELKKSAFALDGIGVIVNPKNPLTKLNFNELKRIFTGEQKEWKDLDGDNKDVYTGKIKVFIARKNASVHDIFRERVLAGAEFGANDIICSTSSQMMREIKENVDAIGFISMAWITVSNDTLDESVKPLKIASVDPGTGAIGDYVGLHQGYIANKTYPLVTEAFIFSTDFSMNLSVGFSSFMSSYDGQRIVLKSGLVPVTQPVKIIQLN